MRPSARSPIGVFDSGIGGLSVVREIRHALPAEDVRYVADTAHCPYGDRPDSEVRARAIAIARHLVQVGAKLLVVACNTASGAALEELRTLVSIPVVGLEPAVKTGVALTRARKIAVMATSSTLRSRRFARLVEAHGTGVEIIPHACPGLVDLIEEGHLDGETMLARLSELTAPLVAAGVDTVVLGCTHYPFVREPLAALLGPGIALVDSGPAIARRTAHLLREAALLAEGSGGSLRIFTTGEPAMVVTVTERVWGEPVEVQPLAV